MRSILAQVERSEPVEMTEDDGVGLFWYSDDEQVDDEMGVKLD